MIGLSLSFCIRDIIEGRVRLTDVEKVIAGTCFMSREQMIERVTEGYCPVYWRKDPFLGLAIAIYLWDHGKVDQPRTRGENAPQLNDIGSIWAKEEV